jgi:nitrous oxidase accessory protein NosD
MRIAIAVLAAAMALTLVTAGAPAKSHRVLRVGTFHGVAGNYKTIQPAVNAANPGDGILVAPGDYKGAVRIKKDDIHLRGLNRNSVIVDGTNSGKACSSKKGDQNFKRGDDGNGIEVFKADGVYIENLTACNFLGEGNQIWWNGGDGNCWHDNSGIAGKDVTSQPADLQSTHAQCGVPNQGDGILSPLADQLICDTGLLRPCPEDATHKYPRTKKVTVKPLPRRKTMPDPCKGVPANPWCKS